jgi:hypothetical protein
LARRSLATVSAVPDSASPRPIASNSPELEPVRGNSAARTTSSPRTVGAGEALCVDSVESTEELELSVDELDSELLLDDELDSELELDSEVELEDELDDELELEDELLDDDEVDVLLDDWSVPSQTWLKMMSRCGPSTTACASKRVSGPGVYTKACLPVGNETNGTC